MNDGYRRYLLAKRTVDERALYRPAWRRVVRALERQPGALLDVATGAGAMIERLGRRGALRAQRVSAVEREACLLAEAQASTAELAMASREWIADDFFRWGERARAAGRSFDCAIACAFLDLVPLEPALVLLRALLRPGGIVYLPICFDGETVLDPPLPPGWGEETILAHYHQTMNERASGTTPGAHSGRRLFGALARQSLELLETGASDWVVAPRGGGYPDDEEFFVSFLIDGVASAVRGRNGLPAEAIEAWRRERLRHARERRLVLVAHHLDFLCARRDG